MRTIRPTRYAHAFDPAEPPIFEVEDGETVIFHADHVAAGYLTFHSTTEDLARKSGGGPFAHRACGSARRAAGRCVADRHSRNAEQRLGLGHDRSESRSTS